MMIGVFFMVIDARWANAMMIAGFFMVINARRAMG